MENICRIFDMGFKEVINLNDGSRLGYVRDVEIELHTGRLVSIIIPGRLRLLGLLGREEDITEGGVTYTIGYEENTNNYKWLAGQNATSKFVYFPIPQRELNTNPTCGQNERW